MDLVEIATRAGPYALFAIMAYMWKLEREERVKLQDALLQAVKVIANVNHTIEEFRSSLFNYKMPPPAPEAIDPGRGR